MSSYLIPSKDQLETPIAQLEYWGLNVKIINWLEKHDLLYIRDLQGKSRNYFRGMTRTAYDRSIAFAYADELAKALRKFLANEPQVTPLMFDDEEDETCENDGDFPYFGDD